MCIVVYVYDYSMMQPVENLLFKGIDRSFELRGESRLVWSVMTNWRLGNYFYFILKGHHHKISKKHKIRQPNESYCTLYSIQCTVYKIESIPYHEYMRSHQLCTMTLWSRMTRINSVKSLYAVTSTPYYKCKQSHQLRTMNVRNLSTP